MNSYEVVETTSPVPPGTKLVFPDAGFLAAFGMYREGDHKVAPITGRDINEDLLKQLVLEHLGIQVLLEKAVGKENIFLSQTSVILGRSSPLGREWLEVNLPTELTRGSQRIPFLNAHGSTWLRDGFTYLNDQVYANEDHWDFYDEIVTISSLGEGGRVLNKDKSVIVSPLVWKAARRSDIADLRRQGFKFGTLPSVIKEKQEYDFNYLNDHIDGHASLIADQERRLHLLIAKSYFEQRSGSMREIREAADYAGVKPVVVDDINLPPLSFNLIQLENGVVIMTGGADALEEVIADLVGKSRVLTTEVELWEIPSVSAGSIRCLTNYLPQFPAKYWSVTPKPFKLK